MKQPQNGTEHLLKAGNCQVVGTEYSVPAKGECQMVEASVRWSNCMFPASTRFLYVYGYTAIL